MNRPVFTNLKLVLQRIEKFELFGRSVVWDQFTHTAKSPEHSKIVILQSSPFIRNLVEKQFTNYHHVQPADQDVQKIAEQVQLESTQSLGALLFGFPHNARQAENLDRLLDGVNLAINFKLSPKLAAQLQSNYLTCGSCGKVFNTELPFVAPTHPGYQNNCSSPTKCNLSLGSAEIDQASEELLKYYSDKVYFLNIKGLLLEYEIDEDHIYYDSQEFKEKLDTAVLTHIKV